MKTRRWTGVEGFVGQTGQYYFDFNRKPVQLMKYIGQRRMFVVGHTTLVEL